MKKWLKRRADSVKWNNYSSPSYRQGQQNRGLSELPSYNNDYDNDGVSNRYEYDDDNDGIMDDYDSNPWGD